MTVKKRNVLIGLIAIAAACLAFVAVVEVRYMQQYAILDDYVAAHASEVGPLSNERHIKFVCKNAEGNAGHCRAVQYPISGRQCIAVSRDLLGGARCQNGKDVTFRGHTLHVSTGGIYPQDGDYLTVSYIR